MSHLIRSLKVDRPVLVSNLIAGVVWLLLAVLWIGPWLPIVGALYVVAGSVFLAAVYMRDTLSHGQEALAWATPWLVAVALWALVGAQIGGGYSASGWLLDVWFGFMVATPCYLVWQVLALALRQFMAWRSGTAPQVADSGD
jgi:hypothetical protein